MRKQYHIAILHFCLVLLFAQVGTVFAQQQTDQDESERIQILQQRDIVASSLEQSNLEANFPENINNNSIYIQQIGSFNQVFSSIDAETSSIQLFQEGSNNLIDINETANDITKVISQQGNQNVVRDFSLNPDASTNLDIIQEGNNLYFERFGTNELTKSLKFRMSGEARSIIVRSF